MVVWLEWLRPYVGPDQSCQVFSTKENVVGYWDDERKRSGMAPLTDEEKTMAVFDMTKNGESRMPISSFGLHGLVFSCVKGVEVDEYYTRKQQEKPL